MPQDTALELPSDWLKRETRLFSSFNAFYRLLKRMHSAGGEPNQYVQQRERLEQGKYTVTVTVLPLGVEIGYSAAVSGASGDDVRIDQKVVFRGMDTGEKREVGDSYVVPAKDGGIVSGEHPLTKGTEHLDAGNALPAMLRSYVEMMLGQCRACSGRKGLTALPVEMISGVPGVSRRLSLAQISSFSNPHDKPYDGAELDRRVLSVLREQASDIREVEHDGLYILDRETLIECGDSLLLEGIISQYNTEAPDEEAKLRSAYELLREQMSLYEHDGAIVRLVESIFPESGSVLVYPCATGVIRPLFRHYVFHPPEGTQALFDEKENLLSLKERRLDMFFIGETAGAELKGLMLDYVMRIDEITARRKKLDSLKE